MEGMFTGKHSEFNQFAWKLKVFLFIETVKRFRKSCLETLQGGDLIISEGAMYCSSIFCTTMAFSLM